MKYIAKKTLLSGLAVLVLFMTSGCQPQNVSSFFIGNQVSADDSLPLIVGEQRSGQWKTFDMLVNYKYRAENSSLEISGDSTLSDFYQINMRSLRDMDMFLFFLDDQRKVLETVQLFKSRSTDLGQSRSFNNTLAVPAGATAISFGYRGFAKEGRRVGGQRFDHLPKQAR